MEGPHNRGARPWSHRFSDSLFLLCLALNAFQTPTPSSQTPALGLHEPFTPSSVRRPFVHRSSSPLPAFTENFPRRRWRPRWGGSWRLSPGWAGVGEATLGHRPCLWPERLPLLSFPVESWRTPRTQGGGGYGGGPGTPDLAPCPAELWGYLS